MVTAVAAVLARRGVLFTLPPKWRPPAEAGAAVLGATAGALAGENREGEGCGEAGTPYPASEDRQAALLFAAGRGGR